MSNLSPTAATARVPQGTVRLVAALTVPSWFGMILHDRISLPELSLLAPDVVLPTVVFVTLFVARWAWPGRLSVLPLPFLPFVPEQTIQHYVAHALYARCQLPLLFVLFRHRPVRAR